MTKKDYIVIAKVFKQNASSSPTYKVINGLCEVFKQDNPLFDETKFKKACGI